MQQSPARCSAHLRAVAAESHDLLVLWNVEVKPWVSRVTLCLGIIRPRLRQPRIGLTSLAFIGLTHRGLLGSTIERRGDATAAHFFYALHILGISILCRIHALKTGFSCKILYRPGCGHVLQDLAIDLDPAILLGKAKHIAALGEPLTAFDGVSAFMQKRFFPSVSAFGPVFDRFAGLAAIVFAITIPGQTANL